MGIDGQHLVYSPDQRQPYESSAVHIGCFSLRSKTKKGKQSKSSPAQPSRKAVLLNEAYEDIADLVTCLPARKVAPASIGYPDSVDSLHGDLSTLERQHVARHEVFGDKGHNDAADLSSEPSMHDSGSSFKDVGLTKNKGTEVHRAERRGLPASDLDSAEESGDEGAEEVLKAEWQIDPLDIYFCSHKNNKLLKLGKGGFGTVYKGVWKERKVAVKVCRQQHLTAKAMKQFQTEVAILNSCSHPNVVEFIGACCWKGGKRTVLVTEYMEKGDLCTALGKASHIYAWDKLGKRIALDVATGLAFLHSRNVVHFDLKSANILLDRSNRAKLADVGLAKTLTEYHGGDQLSTFLATGDLGTFAWAAPEVLLGFSCNCQADIFSFGVLMWELTTGEMPQGRCLRPLRVPEEAPQEVASLIMECLRHDPAMRPSAPDLLEALKKLQ